MRSKKRRKGDRNGKKKKGKGSERERRGGSRKGSVMGG